LRRGVTLEEIGGAALYLLSDLSTGVTGDVQFVDSGYNIITMPQPSMLKNGDEAQNGNGGEAAKDAAQ
jgi:enoyl-[acyl-carrier protein] reductase I